jgi:arylesterase/paraoxonase
MRLVKKMAAVLLLLLLAFVANILVTTGYFRTIEYQFDGIVLEEIQLKGAEDLMVSLTDSFVLISATNRAFFPSKDQEEGGLYLMDLTIDKYQLIPLTTSFEQVFAPHGISFFKKDSSYQVMAINHTTEGHSIEVFELSNKRLQYIKTLKDASMISPNDLVMIDEHRFYFTNDHKYTTGLKRLAEDYAGLAISNVIYFDGKDYREVASGIAYANGINFDRNRNLMFVASPRHFLVKVYAVKPDGSLSFIENIPCDTGVDNIELDEEGHLWVGSHPNLLRFAAYAKGKKETAPSEIIKIAYRGTDDYSVEKIYVGNGERMSASTVAAPFGDVIFTGSVLDSIFLILKQNSK